MIEGHSQHDMAAHITSRREIPPASMVHQRLKYFQNSEDAWVPMHKHVLPRLITSSDDGAAMGTKGTLRMAAARRHLELAVAWP